MDSEKVERAYREYLSTLSLSALRVLGRQKGLPKATAAKKETLVDDIVSILTGKRLPAPPSKKGAPVKQDYLDPAIEEKLEEIGKTLVVSESVWSEEGWFGVLSHNAKRELPAISGILEIDEAGNGFLRVENAQPSKGDVSVPAGAVTASRFRCGDRVSCRYQTAEDGTRVMRELVAVNSRTVGQYEQRADFEALTPCYPTQKINLSFDRSAFSLRVIDFFTPIGLGQRALLVAPPRTGKSTLFCEIASSIVRYHRDLKLMVLLVNERPEEVTEFRSALGSAEVYSTDFDSEAERHAKVARLVLEAAKRWVEMGENVVLLLDSLTTLYRAFAFRKGASDGDSLLEIQRFFGSARNVREGGSLTVLATICAEERSEGDRRLYEAVRDIFNSVIYLSEALARRRIFPAVDLLRSGTKKEELLLTKEELATVNALRESDLSTERIFALLKKTDSNDRFVEGYLSGKIKTE